MRIKQAPPLTPEGKPARQIPDPRKIGTRLSQRLLPQLPHVAPTKIRKTARPR
jgi:hypothetical protein